MPLLYIKNMVCPRCIDSVKDLFQELNIPVDGIVLGQVELKTELSDENKLLLNKKLIARGFELLGDHKSQLIMQIKSLIIDQIHYAENELRVNFSTLLSEKLNHEYTSLSKLFSSVEGLTIEKYILKQKIERVKELIFYKELSLSEIANQMGYSSVSHLSSQFKKETGITPSAFKMLNSPDRQSLDLI